MTHSNIPTPHINALKGDFAATVLMPGDPLRSQFIAEHFLTDARLVNNVRGILGYTGSYKGKRISVMASGMGMPSMGIYSYELFNYYDVENIIRIGSAGMLSPSLKIRDIVAAVSAYTNSNFGRQFGFDGHLAPCASYDLLARAMNVGTQLGQIPVAGPVYSSDAFYDESNSLDALSKLGVLAVEMETAALYLNAARFGKKALALLTISDNPFTGDGLDAEARQNTLNKMIEIALEIA